MNTEVTAKNTIDLDRLIIQGDLSRLSPDQRVQYYYQRCKEHGLNPASKPFEYIRLNGKEVLYATKGCAEQLRSVHGVSIDITKADQVGDLFVVVAKAKDRNGREDCATGAVSIVGLKGEALANAMMKAETKAKRRVTLSVCGLNMLDETEADSIRSQNKVIPQSPEPGEIPHHPLDDTYRIPFGKFVQRTLEEVGPGQLGHYVEYIEKKAAKEGTKIEGKVAYFIKRAEDYIASFENGPIYPEQEEPRTQSILEKQGFDFANSPTSLAKEIPQTPPIEEVVKTEVNPINLGDFICPIGKSTYGKKIKELGTDITSAKRNAFALAEAVELKAAKENRFQTEQELEFTTTVRKWVEQK